MTDYLHVYPQDENIIPIFLTFFRKFMKPYDLVKMLVDRYAIFQLKKWVSFS